jgi:hypothetical protein
MRIAAILLAAATLLPAQQLLEVRRIWDQAPHNAFTDLVRFNGVFYCVFREGESHVSPDGKIRVLRSKDGADWESAALISSKLGDLRDPKISVTPKRELMLVAAAALRPGSEHRHQTLAWFSSDGVKWLPPRAIGEPDFWLWRVAWHKGKAYGAGYATKPEVWGLKMYVSEDAGRTFRVLFPEAGSDMERDTETAVAFEPPDTIVWLIRRTSAAMVQHTNLTTLSGGAGFAMAENIGGPALLRLPNGRYVAAGRLYKPRQRTALCWLDFRSGEMTEFLELPSGGDNSYPGLVYDNGVLWVSYYSSHEGKASIYLARVKLN